MRKHEPLNREDKHRSEDPWYSTAIYLDYALYLLFIAKQAWKMIYPLEPTCKKPTGTYFRLKSNLRTGSNTPQYATKIFTRTCLLQIHIFSRTSWRLLQPGICPSKFNDLQLIYLLDNHINNNSIRTHPDGSSGELRPVWKRNKGDRKICFLNFPGPLQTRVGIHGPYFYCGPLPFTQQMTRELLSSFNFKIPSPFPQHIICFFFLVLWFITKAG